ncbi:phospholipase A2 [Spirillospora sp. NPDC048823]|uniref:phospholipase A2 n=1 Tax=unclassified Spirillospora TaxID=2642701 RepID=UPI0037220370
MLLLASCIVVALLGSAVRTAGDEVQGAICRLFSSDDCDSPVRAAPPAGEDDGPTAAGGAPSQGQDPPQRHSLRSCRSDVQVNDVPDWSGCGPPPGTIPSGGSASMTAEEEAEEAAEAARTVGRAVGELARWWPIMLHPEDLLRFVYGHDSVWTDFPVEMGYTPERVETPYGTRMINPEGSCSTPTLPGVGQAPPGDTGRSFDFTYACQAHDYAYDMMRFYERMGIPHDPEARRAADSLFEADLFAHCATRSGVDRWSCDNWATIYAAAVFANSDRQDFGVP